MPELAIDNRPILPVRLIPLATGWKLSPDVVVQMLAKSDKWYRVYIPSFHLLPDNSFHPMLPKEWDVFNSDLEILSAVLHADDSVEGESYKIWRMRSIEALPAATFVWLDDLKDAYQNVNSFNIHENDRPGDKEINLQPFLPSELNELIFEGFSQGNSSSAEALNSDEQPDTTTQEKPGSSSEWKKEARKIGLAIYKKHPHLNLERIAELTRKEMVKREVTGRGGRVPQAGTIKKHAFSGLKK